MVLGFFSFAKFLMYRDLDPDNWPAGAAIDSHPLIRAILQEGFPEQDELIPAGFAVDQVEAFRQLDMVVDADSSQSMAIAEAAGGRSLVVKGPPGTGKSQTITNIIAAAAARGRKVLFVAEKMAALEVVQRRLHQSGLGALLLELHSNKANKRDLLEELRRTRDAAPPPARLGVEVVDRLAAAREPLDRFAERFHQPLEPCGMSPYQIVGRQVSVLRQEAPGGHGLTGAAAWRPAEVEDRRRLVQDLAQRCISLGPPAQHPWRGVGREALDPTERDELGRRVAEVAAVLQKTLGFAATGENLLGGPPPRTIADLGVVGTHFEAARSLPGSFDRAALAHLAWADDWERLERLVELGTRLETKKKELTLIFNSAGWEASWADIRRAVVVQGASLFRWLSSEYRAQIALFRSYLRGNLPKGREARLALIDRLIALREVQTEFRQKSDIGAAFGGNWRGEDSSWPLLGEVVAWRRRHAAMGASFWRRLAESGGQSQLGEAGQGLLESLPRLRELLESLFRDLRLDLGAAFVVALPGELPVEQLAGRLTSWSAHLESLTRFIAFASRCRELAALGAASLIEALGNGTLLPAQLVPAFERAYAETLREQLFLSHPELRGFDGERQDHLVQIFRGLDRDRFALARQRITVRHAADRPRGNGGVGALGMLNAELGKKRRHLPIRVLLEKAGPVIQQLKPIFMMSPLSVAQYLKPGGLKFDLLVMDEASQIEPVDALGAIGRVDQIVVVGDERQLPPTSFFKKLLVEDSPDEDDENAATLQAKDAESILDLCLAKGAPHRLLSWHYRSRHPSLIAVSNQEFYDDRLFVIPSPYSKVAGLGLKFHHLPDTVYDRGGTRTNHLEAKAVVAAVLRHARETPDLSLGVATFSVAQRQAVLLELELARRSHPKLESFFTAKGVEPFFVKNLENLQGDERDVIFISVGYGRTAQGKIVGNFGPLSREGGERRLNVLISRAKLRCEVFCNFTGAELEPGPGRRGVSSLKLFLTFAQTGHFGSPSGSTSSAESELDGQLCEALRSRGYEVETEIGASGFRVAVAIADPEHPGRLLLGIESDGEAYRDARSTRDRDRLRREVLEGHGWILHQIWSTDWYLRPLEEMQKLEAAIAAARRTWHDRDTGVEDPKRIEPPSAAPVEESAVAFEPLAEQQKAPSLPVGFYREASFFVITALEPHLVPTPEMADHVVRVVEREGPVHVDEIAARIRTLWGLQRAGSRIRAAVENALRLAHNQGRIQGGPFFTVPGQKIEIRDRSIVNSTSLRKPEMLPPDEIAAALLKVVADNYGAGQEELIVAAARLFGFAATSSQLRQIIGAEISRLLVQAKLIQKDGLLVRGRSE